MKSIKAGSLIVAAVLGIGMARAGRAAEWSHIMGPRLDRKTDESVAAWKGAPKQLWEVPVEGGFSSLVTGDGRAYTMVQEAKHEVGVALDRKTGKVLWKTAPLAEASYEGGGERGATGNNGGDGPRGTPTFAAGKVFFFDGKFVLHAVEATSGKTLWKQDLVKDFGGSMIHWSNAASPLVLGDRVIVAGGGRGQSIVAFRVDTGAVIWKAGNEKPTYTTPVPAKIHGVDQVLFMMASGLVSIDPASGKQLWDYAFPQQVATATSPVAWNDLVFVTAGYGVGGGACKVTKNGDKWSTAEVWRSRGNKDAASHWMTPVLHDGYLYGGWGHGSYGTAAFKCIDIRTGAVKWEKPGFGHGQTIMANGKLLAISDAGKLVMLEPTPAKYQELASAKVIDGKVWASVALSDGQLLVRSTKEIVALGF